jgi:hypothetical protein
MIDFLKKKKKKKKKHKETYYHINMNIVPSSTNYSNIDNSRFQLEIPKIMSNNTSINPEKHYPVGHLLSTTSPCY